MPAKMQAPAPEMPDAAHRNAEQQEHTFDVATRSFSHLPPGRQVAFLHAFPARRQRITLQDLTDYYRFFVLYQAGSFCRKPLSCTNWFYTAREHRTM
jgi:hypothetical protein